MKISLARERSLEKYVYDSQTIIIPCYIDYNYPNSRDTDSRAPSIEALVDAPTELEWKRMDTQKDLECENLDSLLNVSESENFYTQNNPDANSGVLDLHNVSESESRDTQLVNTQNGPESGMEDNQNVPASKGVEFLDSHESKKVNTQNFIENARLKLPNELEYKGNDLLSVPVDKRVDTQNIPEGGMEQNAPEGKNVVLMDLHKSEKVETRNVPEREWLDTQTGPERGMKENHNVPEYEGADTQS